MQAEIEKAGGEALVVETDVTRIKEVEAMVEKTVARFGRLDGAVNNAGITGPTMTPLAEIDEAGWDAALNTNLKAVFMCMKYEIPAMLKGGRGSIVNISSIYGTSRAILAMRPTPSASTASSRSPDQARSITPRKGSGSMRCVPASLIPKWSTLMSTTRPS